MSLRKIHQSTKDIPNHFLAFSAPHNVLFEKESGPNRAGNKRNPRTFKRKWNRNVLEARHAPRTVEISPWVVPKKGVASFFLPSFFLPLSPPRRCFLICRSAAATEPRSIRQDSLIGSDPRPHDRPARSDLARNGLWSRSADPFMAIFLARICPSPLAPPCLVLIIASIQFHRK